METKTCPKCKNCLPIDTGFGYRKVGGRNVSQSWCHPCRRGSWKSSMLPALPPKPTPSTISKTAARSTKRTASAIKHSAPPNPTVLKAEKPEVPSEPKPKAKPFKYSTDKNAAEFVFSQSKRFSAPDHDEQVALIKRFQQGDREARQEYIQRNLGLIRQRVNRAGKYSFHDPEDLFQEAIFGLVRAGENFNPDLGFRFSTYAAKVIDQFMLRAVKAKERLVKLSPTVAAKLAKVQRAWSKCMADGEQPTQGQLAAMCELSIKELDQCKLHLMDYVYFDGHTGEEDYSLLDTIPSPGQSVAEKTEVSWDVQQLYAHLDKLTPRDAEFIRYRYGIGLADNEPRTRVQLAQKYEVSELEIQRWEKRVLSQLRNSFPRELLNEDYFPEESKNAASRPKAKRTTKAADSSRNPQRPSEAAESADANSNQNERAARLRRIRSLGDSLRGCQSFIREVAGGTAGNASSAAAL